VACAGAGELNPPLWALRRLVDPEVLILINKSARGHYLEENLKHRICERRRPPPRALKQHDLGGGGFKLRLQGWYLVTQESRIGIDEVAYLILSGSVEQR
jgi:hypothetical protein